MIVPSTYNTLGSTAYGITINNDTVPVGTTQRPAGTHGKAAALAFLSTAFVFNIMPASRVMVETARTVVEAFAPDQRLDVGRSDLRLLARVRELALYPANWDGSQALAPSSQAINDAETFLRSLPLDEIHLPHISVATDGEINFLWKLENFKLDLGFYGDGTYSYYGLTKAGKEFFSDARDANRSLPKAIIRQMTKRTKKHA